MLVLIPDFMNLKYVIVGTGAQEIQMEGTAALNKLKDASLEVAMCRFII